MTNYRLSRAKSPSSRGDGSARYVVITRFCVASVTYTTPSYSYFQQPSPAGVAVPCFFAAWSSRRLMACSIPSFEDLAGILTGVTIVSAGTYAVTLPWALGDYDDGRSHGVLHVATAVGLPLSAYIVAASIYFATTIPYSSDFFCDG